MGDRIAQLIFEKIKAPKIKETNDLEGPRRGESGYGSMGTTSEPKTVVIKPQENQEQMQLHKETIPINKNERSRIEKARQIISARQIQKLAKEDHPIFLATLERMICLVNKRNDLKTVWLNLLQPTE